MAEVCDNGEEGLMGPQAVDELKYKIEDTPPWYGCALLGLQHFMMMFLSEISTAIIVAGAVCVGDDHLGTAYIINTFIFMAGVTTLIQTTFGSRLPIVQGSSLAFLPGLMAIMSLPKWKCPSDMTEGLNGNSTNSTNGINSSAFENAVSQNMTGPTILQSSFHNISMKQNVQESAWKERMREVQGALIVGALFEMLLGFSGILGPMLTLVGPLVIAVVISLLGIAQIPLAVNMCASWWPASALTVALIVFFSQYVKSVHVPLPSFNRRKSCHLTRYPLFLVFPLLLSVLIAWMLCAVLTVTEVLSPEEGGFGYEARTDVKANVVQDSAWLRIPYPFQWGLPTFSATAVLGMFAAVLASTVESIGDYYACARMCQLPPPPVHAVNRGIAMEGLGCLLCGMFGMGPGTTSYSTNIALIGITKVASRRVVKCAGLWMLLMSILGKFGGLFATMPKPVMGGTYLIYVGFLTAAGMSNLQFVNLNSSRNMFALGFSLAVGLGIPHWTRSNPGLLNTGSTSVDQILTVLLKSEMLLGGLTAFIFDNTVPGSASDRGLDRFRKVTKGDEEGLRAYNFPYGMGIVRRHKWTRYIPCMPTYTGCCLPEGAMSCKKKNDSRESLDGDINIAPKDHTKL